MSNYQYRDVLSNGMASATASIASRILTHPLDTAKARIQATGNIHGVISYRGTIDVILRTIQNEGFFALYGGFGAIAVGGTPGTMLYLCSYDWIKRYLYRDSNLLGSTKIPDFAVHFISGMLAESVACIVYVPVDVIKERLQVQISSLREVPPNHFGERRGNIEGYRYQGSWDALKQIIRNEGFAGIYKGYGATLASFGPFSALYFLLYEQIKALCGSYLKSSNSNDSTIRKNETKNRNESSFDTIPFQYLVLASASSGAIAAWVTSPLDMAKLRLQIQRGKHNMAAPSEVGKYRNIVDCLLKTYHLEGPKGLWRGALARVIHFTPATCITMTCYEKCRSFYDSMLR